MIIMLGTKGMVIKVAAIMREFDKRKIDYKYVQSDQHPSMNRILEKQFGLKSPDLILRSGNEDLKSLKDITLWFSKCFWRIYKNRNFFIGEKLLLTQGDTTTTLIAGMVANIFKLKLAHVEAGLRSFSLVHPFPEELIRRIVSKWADHLFAPSDWATKNLSREKGKIINCKQNSVYDILGDFVKIKKMKKAGYAVYAIHRQETIFSAPRLTQAVDIVRKISRFMNVKYILHVPSEVRLKKYNLMDALIKNPRIELLSYQNYLDFMNMVANSEFVVSDGGGLQEECYFLDVPCLLLRNRTERKIGLGETAFLSEFKSKKIEYFIKHYKQFRRKKEFIRKYPSKKIVDVLLKEKVF